MTMRAVLIVFFASLILSGCRSPQPIAVIANPAAQQAAWEQQQVLLTKLTQWQASGKIAIKHQNKGQSARWSWQHIDPHFDNIVISGPLNQGTVILNRDDKTSTLTNAKGQVYRSDDPHTLLLKTTGWSLPINSLYYWVRGLPDPTLPKRFALNEQGALAALNQNEWHIEYLEYQFTHNHWLPQKISIQRDDTYITLLLTTWELE